jgi:hypothetical protein
MAEFVQIIYRSGILRCKERADHLGSAEHQRNTHPEKGKQFAQSGAETKNWTPERVRNELDGFLLQALADEIMRETGLGQAEIQGAPSGEAMRLFRQA